MYLTAAGIANDLGGAKLLQLIRLKGQMSLLDANEGSGQ